MGLHCAICHRRSKHTAKNFPERTYKEVMKEFTKKDGTKYKKMTRIPWGWICKVCVRKDVAKWQRQMKEKHGDNWLDKWKKKFKQEQFRDHTLRNEAKAVDKVIGKDGNEIR